MSIKRYRSRVKPVAKKQIRLRAILPSISGAKFYVYWSIFALIGIAWFIGVLFYWFGQQRLDSLVFSNQLRHINENELRMIVEPHFAAGNFFTIDLQVIQNQIQSMPWVESVALRRNWPSELDVKIIERVPMGYWNRVNLISQKGDLFRPNGVINRKKLPAFLVNLEGPENQVLEVVRFYQKIKPLFLPLSLQVASVSLSPSHDWVIILDNQLVITVDQAQAWSKLTRFSMYYPILVREQPTLARVDLRYSQGFAIGLTEKVGSGPRAPTK
jgi:cell division protein FtsQ